MCARGYIPTSMSLDEAIGALWSFVQVGEFLPASCIISRDTQIRLAGRPFGIFTVRQAAVVKAIRQGKPNKIIAYELKMKGEHREGARPQYHEEAQQGEELDASCLHDS